MANLLVPHPYPQQVAAKANHFPHSRATLGIMAAYSLSPNYINSKMTAATPDLQLGHLIIPLLRGVQYQDGDARFWNSLLLLQAQVVDYIAPLGLELVLDEAEGYAFLRTRVQVEEEDKLPRLMVRRQLSFQVSLILALLRKKMAECDVSGGDTRLILTREQIVETVRVFLPENHNEVRLIDQIETHLNKIEELGFVRKLKGSNKANAVYEIKRILKAFVDAQWLSEFDTRLATYQAQLASAESSDDA